MINKNYAAVCGTYCGHCVLLGKQCRGCGYVDGKPFWTNMISSRICPLHDCCRNQMQLEHCGLCDQFPCNTLMMTPNPCMAFIEPGMDNEKLRKSLKKKKESLKRRAEIGTDKWLLEIFNS